MPFAGISIQIQCHFIQPIRIDHGDGSGSVCVRLCLWNISPYTAVTHSAPGIAGGLDILTAGAVIPVSVGCLINIGSSSVIGSVKRELFVGQGDTVLLGGWGSLGNILC